VLAEGRALVLPIVDLADRDLEAILCRRWRRERRKRERADERCPKFASHFVLRVRLRVVLEAAREARLEVLREVLADTLDEARGGRRPASASRIDQYSQVRPTTLGSALREPASCVSPLDS